MAAHGRGGIWLGAPSECNQQGVLRDGARWRRVPLTYITPSVNDIVFQDFL
jgi:hypothetical protein